MKSEKIEMIKNMADKAVKRCGAITDIDFWLSELRGASNRNEVLSGMVEVIHTYYNEGGATRPLIAFDDLLEFVKDEESALEFRAHFLARVYETSHNLRREKMMEIKKQSEAKICTPSDNAGGSNG